MRNRRRGVSELIATVALIAVTLAAMFIYMQGLTLYSSGESGLLSGALQSGSIQNYERLSVLYMFKNSTALYLVTYNYGAVNATISRLVVNSNPVASGVFTPTNLPSGSLAIIAITPGQYSGQVQVSLITENGNVFYYIGVI